MHYVKKTPPIINYGLQICDPNYSPASKVSREVENLTEKEYTHTCIWCQWIMSVCLSVCNELWPFLSQDWVNKMGFLSIFGIFNVGGFMVAHCSRVRLGGFEQLCTLNINPRIWHNRNSLVWWSLFMRIHILNCIDCINQMIYT